MGVFTSCPSRCGTCPLVPDGRRQTHHHQTHWICCWEHLEVPPLLACNRYEKKTHPIPNCNEHQSHAVILQAEMLPSYLKGNILWFTCPGWGARLPWHGSVQFVQVWRQAVLQDVVDDQLSIVVVLLQAGQQEAIAQIWQQVFNARQQRIQLRLAQWTRCTLTRWTGNMLFRPVDINYQFSPLKV